MLEDGNIGVLDFKRINPPFRYSNPGRGSLLGHSAVNHPAYVTVIG